MSLTSLLPAFFMAIRWSASFGDSSRVGTNLVNNMIHFVNAVIFGVSSWVMFDPPLSPLQLMQGLGIKHAGAHLVLCGGLVHRILLRLFSAGLWQKAQVLTGECSRPEPALPKGLLWLCPIIVAGTLATSALAAGCWSIKTARHSCHQ